MPKFDFSEEAITTNASFADEIARLTRLSTTEVEKLFPTKVDKERLVELLKIVKSSTSRNDKVANLRQNIATLGETVIKLVGALA